VQEIKPNLFIGSQNVYMDIGRRGDDRLSLSIQYSDGLSLGANVVGFLFRFVAWNPAGPSAVGPFTYMQVREGAAQFLSYFEGTTFPFHGIRLTKFFIPAFSPAMSLADFMVRCDDAMMWNLLGDWIVERAKEEGFEPIHSVEQFSIFSRDMVSGKLAAHLGHDNFKIILSLYSFKEINDFVNGLTKPKQNLGILGEGPDDES
jgi:hypothetical protein